jgi:hypothetical protein
MFIRLLSLVRIILRTTLLPTSKTPMLLSQIDGCIPQTRNLSQIAAVSVNRFRWDLEIVLDKSARSPVSN